MTLKNATEKMKYANTDFISDSVVLDCPVSSDADFSVFDSEQYVFLPGFCDVHVHFREPGFSYKETIETGSLAAAHGGYTDVCTMPNLSPVPDSPENIEIQHSLIRKGAVIGVHPYASITVGQKGEVLSDMNDLSKLCIAFSDDGKGVQSDSVMLDAMLSAKSLDKIIAAHCEVNSLLHGGYIHDGTYAKEHGHKGICSESEYLQIERDIALAKKTGCKYHVCHISAKESVQLIRQAKRDGVDITCETAPHYLIYSDRDLCEDGSWKMNPPLRDISDRAALIDGIIDGTIDMIATDHAPHSDEEKSKGLANSNFGIVGIETAFPAMYTHFVKTGIITMQRLLQLMCHAPRERFGIAQTGFSVWNLSKKIAVDPKDFLSKGKSTLFNGVEMYGECLYTSYSGKTAYKK